MLVISRKTGEEIQIGDSIKITIVNVDKGVVRLGIDAPKDIPIRRIELNTIDETKKTYSDSD
jgi:carbon storage regulator